MGWEQHGAMRIATFNLENFDDKADAVPSLAKRVALMRPQLLRMRADVLCLQEVNAQGGSGERELRALDVLLEGTPYAGFERATTVTEAGELYAQRGLVVLSRYPITATRQYRSDLARPPMYARVTADPPDEEARTVRWERPILHVSIELPDGVPLEVINVHLKSKNPVAVPGALVDPFTWRTAAARAEGSFLSAMQRLGQALETRMLVEILFDTDPDSRIALCGDFNAEADDVEIRALRGDVEENGNPELAPRVLVLCERTIPQSTRYSLLYQGNGEMIDHILASRALLALYRGAEVHNELLHDESVAFATDDKFPESDHAPVVAEFTMPLTGGADVPSG